jgi:hypothetical protein
MADVRAEKERKTHPFDDLTLACGAKWACDTNGVWYLFKPNGLKEKPLVEELYEHLGVKNRLVLAYGENQAASIIQKDATLVEFGMGLPMSYLQRAHETKDHHRDEVAPMYSEDHGGEAECPDGK